MILDLGFWLGPGVAPCGILHPGPAKGLQRCPWGAHILQPPLLRVA